MATELPKKPRQLSTIRRKQVAKKIAEKILKGEHTTASKLLQDVGYSKTTAEHKQKEILSSPEVQAELEKVGFTEMKAMQVLSSIMNSNIVYEMVTPDNQIRAAQEVFKVMGSYAPEKKQIITADLTSLLQDIENDEKKPDN